MSCFIYDENLQVSGRMNASDFKTCSEEALILIKVYFHLNTLSMR